MYVPSVATCILTNLKSNCKYGEHLCLYRIEHDEEYPSLEEKITKVLGISLLPKMDFDLAIEFICFYLANISFYDLTIKEIHNTTLGRQDYWLEFKISDEMSISLNFPTESDKFLLDFGSVRLRLSPLGLESFSESIGTTCRDGVDELRETIRHYQVVASVLELFGLGYEVKKDFGYLEGKMTFEKYKETEKVKVIVAVEHHCINSVQVSVSNIEDELEDEVISLSRNTDSPLNLLGTLKNILRII